MVSDANTLPVVEEELDHNSARAEFTSLVRTTHQTADRDRVVAQALKHNRTIGKLDWGQAAENLFVAAKFTAAGSDNDKEMAAQFGDYVNNAGLVKIGQFRMSLEAAEKSPKGSELHRVAVNKALETLGDLTGNDKTTALKMLEEREKQGSTLLIDGMQPDPVAEDRPVAEVVSGTQRDMPNRIPASLHR